jgi:hypothetical protein
MGGLGLWAGQCRDLGPLHWPAQDWAVQEWPAKDLDLGCFSLSLAVSNCP